LIVTDGNISKDNKKLTLSLTDKQVIEQLSKYFINTERRKIYEYQPKLKNASRIYSLINANVDTIKKLKALGIIPNKTYTQRFPKIEDGYIYDFLRGVFDGDGCIYVSNRKYGGYFSISFTSGSESFAKDLFDVFILLGYTPKMVLDNRTKNNEHKTYCIRLNKRAEVELFMRCIYKDAQSIMIQYKYDKYYNKNMA
jgi:intein/homing endonuclease